MRVIRWSFTLRARTATTAPSENATTLGSPLMTWATRVFSGRGAEEPHSQLSDHVAPDVRPADRGHRSTQVGPAHHRFSSAFELAGLIALAGFATALIAVRNRQSPEAAARVEVEAAA
jgi:hypothetical protein